MKSKDKILFVDAESDGLVWDFYFGCHEGD